MMIGGWIDELERDLGLSARLVLILNAGGQRREIPGRLHAARSRLAFEVGPEIAGWLADRFGGTALDIPSPSAQQARDAASRLRAAVLEAGLTDPVRSANDLAREFGVTSMWVRKLRAQMRRDLHGEAQLMLPLFGTSGKI